MITAVFQCSSPFVGYTIRVADYQKKRMTECSAGQMTKLGWKVFQVSGTYAILMDSDNRRYFHARQSESKAYDEQGRRIYTNVAFVGAPDSERDNRTVTNIALYELFEPERFYQEIAGMIRLTDEGFEVEFEKLEHFLKQLEMGFQCRTESRQAKELWEEILHSVSHETIRFVVLEATWEYFVKQAGTDFGRSVKRMLSLQEAKKYASQAELVFAGSEERKTEKREKTEEGPIKETPGKEATKSEIPKTEEPVNEVPEVEALKRKLSEAVREQEALTAELSEKNGMIARQRSELDELKGTLISARTETDRLEAALSRSKLFIIAAAAAGALLAAVICHVFL